MKLFMKNVELLPIWKKNASDGDRLRELALLADKKPEQFDKWVFVYCEDNDKRFKVRYISGEKTRTSDIFSVLAAGQQHVWDHCIK